MKLINILKEVISTNYNSFLTGNIEKELKNGKIKVAIYSATREDPYGGKIKKELIGTAETRVVYENKEEYWERPLDSYVKIMGRKFGIGFFHDGTIDYVYEVDD